VVKNCSRAELEPIIKGQVLSQTTVYPDGWLGYDGLLLSGYKHPRIHYHEKRVCPRQEQRDRELLELRQVSLRQAAWRSSGVLLSPSQGIGMALA
jgi:transposase-like protein